VISEILIVERSINVTFDYAEEGCDNSFFPESGYARYSVRKICDNANDREMIK